MPNDSAVGQAIVVYDPGLTGIAKDVASQIGFDIQDSGYFVTLAGVKSSAAADVSGYDVVVVGGPIYVGKPAASIQYYLSVLTPSEHATVGVFGCGDIQVTGADAMRHDVASLPDGSVIDSAAAAKVYANGEIKTQCQDFVTRLLS